MTVRSFIAFAHDGENFSVDRFEWINRGAVFVICHDAAVNGPGAGGDCGAIDFGGAEVNGMVIRKPDTPLPKGPEIGRVLFGDEIRTHGIPNDHHHSSRGFFGLASETV